MCAGHTVIHFYVRYIFKVCNSQIFICYNLFYTLDAFDLLDEFISLSMLSLTNLNLRRNFP